MFYKFMLAVFISILVPTFNTFAEEENSMFNHSEIQSAIGDRESTVDNVFLNHVYTMMDERTYEEIKKSDFLKNEFCQCNETTTCTSNEMTWTGFYLAGKNTYIELFNTKDKKSLQSLQIGDVGIGFGVDKKEEIAHIAELFEKELAHDVISTILEKKMGDRLVPWFYYVMLTNDALPKLDTWIMAYHKDYMEEFKNIKISNNDGFTREQYNSTGFDKSQQFPLEKF